MSSRAARLAPIVSFAAALAALARADNPPPPQTRATIRGTGNDVTIVYRGRTGASPRAAAEAPETARGDVIGDAARLAARGDDDASLIAYLRLHQAELPPIVGADSVHRLRRAGAGSAVISDLSRLTALDIGETGEGAPVATSPPIGDGGGYGMPEANAYPFYGGYPGFPTPGFGGFAPRPHAPHRLAARPPRVPPGRVGFPGRSPAPVRGMGSWIRRPPFQQP